MRLVVPLSSGRKEASLCLGIPSYVHKGGPHCVHASLPTRVYQEGYTLLYLPGYTRRGI